MQLANKGIISDATVAVINGQKMSFEHLSAQVASAKGRQELIQIGVLLGDINRLTKHFEEGNTTSTPVEAQKK